MVAHELELLALGIAVTAILLVPNLRAASTVDRLSWKLWRIGAALLAAVRILVAGVPLITSAGDGTYWCSRGSSPRWWSPATTPGYCWSNPSPTLPAVHAAACGRRRRGR